MRCRRNLTSLLIAILLGMAAVALAADGPRNVLLLISDDQGLDAGCYGNKSVTTPAIDRLAADGVRFTNAFAAVSSCSPSRSVIQTGMYNHTNGQYGLAHDAHNQHTRPDVRSLPLILSEHGYRTGLIGKYHLGPDSVYPFEVRTGAHINRKPDELGAAVRDFLTSGSSSPFFLTVGFGDPHRAGGGFALARHARATTESATVKGPALPAFLTDLPEVRSDYSEYCESVNNLDRCMAAVLGALEETGAARSTLVIFLSDNGIPFPGAKTNLYDAGIRLPLIVRAPGRKIAKPANDALVSWVDVAPTVLDWAGIERPRFMQGWSILPLLENPEAEPRDAIFASHTFHEIPMYYPMRCMRTRDFKLIWNLAHQLPYPIAGDIRNSRSWEAILKQDDAHVGGRTLEQYLHRPQFELYDLARDPNETKNLAAEPQHAETLARMKADLLTMMRDTRDPWLHVAEQQAAE